MLGLLIDTSRKPAILCLIEKNRVIHSLFLNEPKELSKNLFTSLEKLLNNKNKDLNYIALGTGPGSYMGIRTAATVAKTLSFALKIPLIPFCSLLAFIPKDLTGPFTFVGDAKMGQLYLVEGEIYETGMANIRLPKLIEEQEVDPKWIENPAPNLEWIANHLYGEYIKENFSTSPELIYLR